MHSISSRSFAACLVAGPARGLFCHLLPTSVEWKKIEEKYDKVPKMSVLQKTYGCKTIYTTTTDTHLTLKSEVSKK